MGTKSSNFGRRYAKISLYGDPKPFCDTCHGSREIQISEGVTVTAQDCNVLWHWNNSSFSEVLPGNIGRIVRLSDIEDEGNAKKKEVSLHYDDDNVGPLTPDTDRVTA